MRILFSLLVCLGIILTGCETSRTQITLISSVTPGGGYPISNQASAYPSQIQSTAPISGYPAVTAATSTMIPTDIPNPSKTPVIIAMVSHPEDGMDVITIKNISQTDQDISLFSLLNPETQEIFPFPDNYSLAPGKEITVYNGNGSSVPEGEKWLDKPFLTEPGATVQLLNQAARIMYTYTYYP